ncbi:MAG TPA: universal stress protein [Terriglobales bacterium]|nr:universal stress protein [Terriglobales bacterium]
MQALQTTTGIVVKNILFLTDFTEASEAALAYAQGIARHYNANLFPAHACNPVILSEGTPPNLGDELEEHGREQLEAILRGSGVKGKALIVQNSLENAFPRWIEENNIDLVIIGTHGRDGVTHFFMGSSAEMVFRNATCPVLTVGPHVTCQPTKDFAIEDILFPIKLGAFSDLAAGYAFSLAQETHGKVTFMNVLPRDSSFYRVDDKDLATEIREDLQTLIPADAPLWCEPGVVVRAGDPALEILRYAEKERPDLIVLGLPQNKNFNSRFRTGVTYKVIAKASCPVLTVRDASLNTSS